MASSLLIAMRRGRDSACGGLYSLISIVTGSSLATFGAPNSTRNGTPFELTTIPYGSDRGVGEVTILISPVFGSNGPVMFAPGTVKNKVPFGAKLGEGG